MLANCIRMALAGLGGGGGATYYALWFNAGDSPRLTRTFSAGNRKTFTISFWVKFSTLSNTPFIFGSGTGASDRFTMYYSNASSELRVLCDDASSETLIFSSTSLSTNTWYHICLAMDTTQATSSNRAKLWINGVSKSHSGSTIPAQNKDLEWNAARSHWIGNYPEPNNYLNGYISEFIHTDGTAYTPADFAEDVSGTWTPIANPSVTYGTNGFRLSFTDDTAIGKDTAVSADQLVTNGTFDTDTTGWTASAGGSISQVSGRIRVANAVGVAYQAITTTIGETYTLTADLFNGTVASTAAYVSTSTSIADQYGSVFSTGSDLLAATADFVATSNPTYLLLRQNTSSAGYVEFDNVTIIETANDFTPVNLDATDVSEVTLEA